MIRVKRKRIDRIRKLKYAVFSEWSNDLSTGEITLYYDHWYETYNGILSILDIIYEDFSMYFDEETEDNKEGDYKGENKNEFNGFLSLYKKRKPQKAWIEDCLWDSGSFGCRCVLVAEGKEVADAAIKFFRDYLENYLIVEEGKIDDNYLSIVKEAEQNPDNYQTVIKLLEMISTIISDRNKSMTI